MTRQTKILLKNICLAASCLVTIVAFLRPVDTDGDFGIVGILGILLILLWGIGPYLLFWLATYLLERFSSLRQAPAIGLGISVPIVLYALFVYLEPLDHKSSTEGLIYFFAPFWLYLALLPLLGLCVFAAWLSNRFSTKSKYPDPPVSWM